MPYLTSVIDLYELLFQKLPTNGGNTTDKAKQEILHGLGNVQDYNDIQELTSV